LEGYKRYVVGVYYQDYKLRETLNKKGREDTFEALRKGYPTGWTYQELTDTFGLKSTYHNCTALHNENIVKREKERGARKRDVQKYYFEDYNYINNEKEHFRFPFAPGYVQYTEDFLRTYKTLNENEKFRYQIYESYSSLINILKQAVRNEKQTRTHQQCKFCGYDHEMRDFMKATLLHLIDELEANNEFIEFMHREGIINKTTYERLISECKYYSEEPATLRMNEQKETAQKEHMKEQQSTYSMENEEQTGDITPNVKSKTERELAVSKAEQIMAEGWFNGLSRLSKKMVQEILSARPEKSKAQLKELVEPRIKNHDRSPLDTILSVAEDLGVSFSLELYDEYRKRIKQRKYEQQPENRNRRNELKRKRRAKPRNPFIKGL
jgi:hypothetical protein